MNLSLAKLYATALTIVEENIITDLKRMCRVDFSFFKHVGESEVKFLWYLTSIGGDISASLRDISKVLSIDEQQLRRTTNKLRDRGYIDKKQIGTGRGCVNRYTIKLEV